jgi:hypothetical protein
MSSLSMNKVRGRAINANTQNTNNYSMWMEPLSHKDYPVTYVATPTENAVITSNGVKNVVVAQPGLIYNNVRLDVSGSVNPTRWTTGQTINTVFLESAQMNQRSDAVSNGTYTVASYTYTPKSNNSRIIVDYSALYRITGDNNDVFESRILIDGTTMIAIRQQAYANELGGGTRSGTLFPICGGIANNALSNRTIAIIFYSTSTDPVQFYGQPYDACMKITEIAL